MKTVIERFLRRKKVREILGDSFHLTQQQADRLLLVLDNPRRVKELEDWLPALAHFVRNDLINYLGRFRWLRCRPASPDLRNLVLRYGKQEALKRHRNICERRTSHLDTRLNHWLGKGYTREDAKREISKLQAERAALAAHVLRGTSEFTIRSVSYWLKQGLTIEESKEQVRRVQITNGLRRKICNPAEVQQDRNVRWLATLRNKPPEEVARICLAKSHTIEGCIARGMNREQAENTSIAYFGRRNNFSNISQLCFDMVSERLGPTGLYYKTLNYEQQLGRKNVDFFDAQSGTVVEFLGDFWHGNPLSYEREFLIHTTYACHRQEDDRRRAAQIEADPRVSKFFIVWESEFRHNPTEVVSDIVEALLIIREQPNAF